MPVSRFQPNDLVVMKNTGLCYSGMFNFFKEYGLPISVVARYAYHGEPSMCIRNKSKMASNYCKYKKDPGIAKIPGSAVLPRGGK